MLVIEADLQEFVRIGLSLVLGLVMGMERERSQKPHAGARTFALAGLLGAVTALLGEQLSCSILVAVGFAAVALLGLGGYWLAARQYHETGLTTILALLIAYTLGVLVWWQEIVLAVAICLAVTVLLYFKPQLHRLPQQLEQRDIYAIFQFGLISCIILPLLPDQNMGPFATLNPRHIWYMVVLISGLSLVGYVVLKLAKEKWGGPVLGVLGGLVSSTATTLAFSRQARNNADFRRTAAVVIILASAVVMVRVAVEVTVVARGLLPSLLPVLGAMFLVGLLGAAICWRSSGHKGHIKPETRNPAEIRTAVTFGLLYAGVLLAVAAAKHFFGSQGVYLVSLISGLTDVDAITLSSARLFKTQVLDSMAAKNAIVLAIVANLAFKWGMAWAIGGWRLARWLGTGFGLIALVAGIMVWAGLSF